MNEQKEALPLETEPLVFFHPTSAGPVAPGLMQPVGGSIRLEEEPATWVQLAGEPPAERTP
jgi:hypothetical protein